MKRYLETLRERSAALKISPMSFIVLAACGSGNGRDVDSPQSTSPQDVHGHAVKGPLASALVFFDYNKNGVLDTGEPSTRTRSDGSYSLSQSQRDFPITIITDANTIDTASGIVLDGVTLKAPSNASVVTPTTTLIVEAGITKEEIAEVLGLPEGVDPLSFNPYADGVDAADALAVEKASQQIMSVVNAFAGAAEGAGASEAEAFEAALSSVVEVVKAKVTNLNDANASAADKTLNLISPEDLELVKAKVVTKVAAETSADTAAFDALADDIVTAVKNVNEKIATVDDLSSEEAKNTFSTTQVLADQTKQAAEAEVQNAGSGSIDFTDKTKVDDAADNKAPTDITLSKAAIAENASSLVIGTLTTTDDQTSDVFTYKIAELTGTDHAAFTINSTTGELSFKSQPDFEAKSSYTITILSTDEGGKTFSKTLTFSDNIGPSGRFTIEGLAIVGETLSANISQLSDIDGLGPIKYRWEADGVAIDEATDANYILTQDEVGKTISVTVSYTDGKGTLEVLQSEATLEVQVQNINDVPVITSSAITETNEDALYKYAFTAVDPDGDYDIDLAVEKAPAWLNFNEDTGILSGTPRNADVGDANIILTATNDDGIVAIEEFTLSVINTNNAPSGDVIIVGAVRLGNEIKANTDQLMDPEGLNELSYQWFSNGNLIPDATSVTYTVTEAEVNSAITVAVSYADGEGTIETVVSSPSGAVAETLSITGIATQGYTLTAEALQVSAPDGLSDSYYVWKANGESIYYTPTNNLTLTQAEVGKEVSVEISYVDDDGIERTLKSEETNTVSNVNDQPVGEITLVGTAMQGQTLTAANTLTDVDGLGEFSYQWHRDGVAIVGATDETYTLDKLDVDAAISVTVSYVDGYGEAETVESAQTFVTSNANNPPTGALAIDGTAAQGETLTLDTSTIADEDGLGVFGYVWMKNGSVVNGKTGSTYTLTQADVGSKFSASISYVDGLGTTETLSSSETAMVVNVNDDPTGSLMISGNAEKGATLSLDTSTIADEDGLGDFTITWFSDGAAIAGALSNTFILTQSEVGTSISAAIEYTDKQGAVESVVSGFSEVVADPGRVSNHGMDGDANDRNPQLALINVGQEDEALILAWQGETLNDEDYDIFLDSPLSDFTAIRLQGSQDGFVDEFPQVTSLGTDGFVVAWQGQSSSSRQSSDIYVQKFNTDGDPEGIGVQKLQGFSMVGEIPRDNNGALDFDKERADTVVGMMPDKSPTVAALKSGFVVAWSGSTTDHQGDEIFIQRFENDGSKAGDIIRLFGMEGELADTNPKIQAQSDGFIVTWSGATSDEQGIEIFIQRFENNGSKAGDIIRLGGMSGKLLDAEPQIAVLPNDEFVVTWRGDTQDRQGWDIFVQKFDAQGNFDGDEFRLNGMSGDLRDMSPQVTALSDGGFMIVWQGWTSDEHGFDIFAQKFIPSKIGEKTITIKDGETTRLSGMDGNLGDWHPKVLADNEGGAFIVWSGWSSDGQNTDIFVERVGHKDVDQKARLFGTPENYSDWAPQVAKISDDQFVVSWHGETSNDQGSDIFTQFFEYNDEILSPLDIL